MTSVPQSLAKPDPQVIAQMQEALALAAHDPQAALVSALRIVASNPQLPPAYRVLAIVRRRMGQERDADRGELESIAVALKLPILAQAQKAFAEGRLADAEPLVRAHLRQDPEDPAGALMLGEIALRSGAQHQAENLFRRAFLLAPAYTEARMALAKAQRETERHDEALTTLEALLEREPSHLEGLSLKAATEVKLHDFDAADATFRNLHAHHPEDARGWTNHAFMLKTVGRIDEAIAAYRHAITIDPAHGHAWFGLSNLKTVRFSEEDAASLLSVLERSDLEPERRLHLLFTLGKVFDDLGDYAGAFAAYAEGAALRLEQTPHDPERTNANTRRARAVFTPTFFASRRDWGNTAVDPIFIVSLPRSGSTLVEQILASHPQVEGTEELFDIERIALSLTPSGGAGDWLDVLPTLDREKVRELGECYIEDTRRFRHTDRPFFTDKMPSNWVFAGLIATILPNAKIVDIRRHPLGCGFANFSQHFNWGINFSYDLTHIGEFYKAYTRQMAHFEAVLPGRIHHLTYESLVEDTETEIRRLLDYLDLPFDSACLRFFENKRAVHTPSSEQVRSPITREGMERWRRYEAFLGPLKEALGPVLEHYPETPPFTD